MAPDLNSLPPSRSISGASISRNMTNNNNTNETVPLQGQSSSPSPRSGSMSLQAAAAVNAGLQHEESGRSSISSGTRRQPSQTDRRRSNVLQNLQHNDPSVPAPGEMVADTHSTTNRHGSPLPGSPVLTSREPHHLRNPSLGELHQELENEQEAQVNRLLQMIRTQQQQLQQLQAASGQSHVAPPAIDESTPTSERSLSFSNPPTAFPHHSSSISTPRSPTAALHPRSSFDLARADLQRRSRTPSRTASPRLRSTSISGEGGENWSLGGRDESAFYQAETQTMIRENQMLRQRIRELERQVAELNSASGNTHEPVNPSHLLQSSSVSEETTTDVTEALTSRATEAKDEGR